MICRIVLDLVVLMMAQALVVFSLDSWLKFLCP